MKRLDRNRIWKKILKAQMLEKSNRLLNKILKKKKELKVVNEDMKVLIFKVREKKRLCYINKIIRFKALDSWKMKKAISQ